MVGQFFWGINFVVNCIFSGNFIPHSLLSGSWPLSPLLSVSLLLTGRYTRSSGWSLSWMSMRSISSSSSVSGSSNGNSSSDISSSSCCDGPGMDSLLGSGTLCIGRPDYDFRTTSSLSLFSYDGVIVCQKLLNDINKNWNQCNLEINLSIQEKRRAVHEKLQQDKRQTHQI